jgi:hypothetical protein
MIEPPTLRSLVVCMMHLQCVKLYLSITSIALGCKPSPAQHRLPSLILAIFPLLFRRDLGIFLAASDTR